MIRVNLLPQKKRPERKGGSQLWMVALLVTLLLEAGALIVWHGLKYEELTEQNRTNSGLQAQIEEAKNSVREHAAVKEKLARLRAREQAIDKLNKARTGPAAILLELARIMSRGRGPTADPVALEDLRPEPQGLGRPFRCLRC